MPYESDYWNPGPKYEAYLDRIREILTSEKRTVRDVYYALEARGFPEELEQMNPDWSFEYRYVKRAVKKGRRAGFIDPNLIYDASRTPAATVDHGYDDPVSFTASVVEGVERNYEENFWRDQDAYVEVWLEKQSLASVFEPICSDHNVRLEATRGDWSDSKIHEAADRLITQLDEGKDVKVLYFGDYNPSGLHAPVAIQNTMAHYGVQFRGDVPDEDFTYFDIWPFTGPLPFNGGGTLEFERLALNTEHVEQYDLPENPTPSSTDKDRDLRDRFMRQVSNGRDVNIELNALKEYHREDLEEILEDGITSHIDQDQREQSEEREQKNREKIGNAVSIDYSEL